MQREAVCAVSLCPCVADTCPSAYSEGVKMPRATNPREKVPSVQQRKPWPPHRVSSQSSASSASRLLGAEVTFRCYQTSTSTAEKERVLARPRSHWTAQGLPCRLGRMPWRRQNSPQEHR